MLAARPSPRTWNPRWNWRAYENKAQGCEGASKTRERNSFASVQSPGSSLHHQSAAVTAKLAKVLLGFPRWPENMSRGLRRGISSLDCMVLFCFVLSFGDSPCMVPRYVLGRFVLHTCLIYSASTITQRAPVVLLTDVCSMHHPHLSDGGDDGGSMNDRNWNQGLHECKGYSFLSFSAAWVKAVVYRWAVWERTAILKRCSCGNSQMTSGSGKRMEQDAQWRLLLHDCACFAVYLMSRWYLKFMFLPISAPD